MEVSVPNSAILADAHINLKHMDGPLLTWAGRFHWLTLTERFLLFAGLTNANMLAYKRFGRAAAAIGKEKK